MLPTYGVEQGTPAVSVMFANSGAPMAYIVMNSTASNPTLGANWAGHTGAKCMAAMAAIPPTAGVTNNDYLTSPQVQLGTAGNTLKFWAKAISATYPEKFRVGVSTTGTLPANFTMITPTAGVTPTTTWVEYTYNLDAYQGQNVYLTIQCVSNDAFALLIDDFKVTATTLKAADFFKSNFTIYPNPSSDVISLSNNNSVVINSIEVSDINGRMVKSVDANSTTFSVRELNAGVYFLKVTTADGVGTTKFIKN
jgi:hypothetical protein